MFVAECGDRTRQKHAVTAITPAKGKTFVLPDFTGAHKTAVFRFLSTFTRCMLELQDHVLFANPSRPSLLKLSPCNQTIGALKCACICR